MRIDIGLGRIGLGLIRGLVAALRLVAAGRKHPVYHFRVVHRVFCLCARIADWLMADVASGIAGGFLGRQPVKTVHS